MMNTGLNLGSFIIALNNVDPEDTVMFDFCGFAPTNLNSDRGYYSDLALGFTEDSTMKVKDLIHHCVKSVNTHFDGYEGGSFFVDLNTPLWVSQYGKTSRTVITGVEQHDYFVIINTTWE